MIREVMKWDYELRIPSKLARGRSRGSTSQVSEPTRGPVYLSLARGLGRIGARGPYGAPRPESQPTT